MDTFLQHLRYSLRTLRKSPTFSAVVVLTLALGIGANSAIFSAVNTLLLRALPYPEPQGLATIYHHYPSLDGLDAPVSAPGFRRYRDETRSFSHVAVSTGWGANLMIDGEAQRVQGMRVSAQYFPLFGVEPALGRTPLAEEDVPGREQVVVLSHGFWQRAFGGDAGIVGKTVTLNGVPHEVIGVMPAGFRAFWGREAELWRPLALTPEQLTTGNNEWLSLSARLRPGVTMEQAAAEMREIGKRIHAETPGEYPPDWGLTVHSLDEVAKGEMRTPLLVLLGAVGFVLLIACANVANLLLARSMERTKEITVRAALGARRADLVRQLLTESVVLSLIGGGLGLLFAWWSVAGLTRLLGDRLGPGVELSIDGPVLAFTVALALATGLLFGLLPALQVTRPDLQGVLREGGRTLAGDRIGKLGRRALVVAEVALALTLLTGAGLLIRSFAVLQGVDPGFRPGNLLTFNVPLPASEYGESEKRLAFFDEVRGRLAALPGVQSVGYTSMLPFSGGWSTGSFSVEGHQPAPDEPAPWGDYRIASPGFHRALGMRLIEGRFIDETDRADAQRVVVVDEGLARRYWPGQSAIGKRISEDEEEWLTVVGVVSHTKQAGLDDEDRVQIYLPDAQVGGIGQASFAVRTTGDPMQLVPSVRREILAVDSDQPISQVRTMEEMMEESLGQRRLSMLLLALFSGLAALLSAIGIYGVISHLVTQRTRELGVRMALGAATSSVVGLVVRQGMGLALAGVALGVLGALGLTRLMASQLFGVDATDPVTFLVTAGLLTVVALVATLLPAARAARLDPVTALREE